MWAATKAALGLWLGLAQRACAFGSLDPRGYAGAWDAEAATKARHFPQKQDHFDPANHRTWMQAYYVNDSLWAGADSAAPVFLYIGGEGPLGASSTTSNFLTDWLPATRALLFAVEHRYYGCHNASSCPYDKALPQGGHLRYLSSRQALADLASFQAFATQAYGLRPGTRWVAFGGSYPGMLAAYLRAEYPELFHAAVASSAPVNVKLDFTEFQDVVAGAYALSVEGVQGSGACREAITSGHAEVGRLLGTRAGRQELVQLFPDVESAAWLANDTNQRAFAGCGVATFPAQGNEPGCSQPGCGITQICALMTNVSLGAPVQRLAALRKLQMSANQVMSCEMDWEMPGDVPAADINYWGYQTCTEFGVYQTCEEGTQCMYSRGIISFANRHHRPNSFCSAQFNISTAQTVEHIRQTRAYYDAKVLAATRIMWVNGNVDPWSALSHLTSPAPEQPALYPVEGARHHAWTSAARDDDQQSVKDARSAIYAQVSTWLSAAEILV